MPGRDPFEYVVIRIVPRVERGEFLNAGVVVISRAYRYLAVKVQVDETRLFALAPWMDAETVRELRRQIEAIPAVAAGDPTAGPIAQLELSERWHWLSAPSSTLIQPGPVHTGLCNNPALVLEELFAELVGTAGLAEAGHE